MWEEILIFFENTKNIWPLFVGCIAFLVYILQERRKVSEAASLIVLQIEDLKGQIKKINSYIIDKKLNDAAFYESQILFQKDYWNEYKHYFVKKMDSGSFNIFDDFYNCASSILEQQQLMKNLQKNFFFLTQQVLAQTESNLFQQAMFSSSQSSTDINQFTRVMVSLFPSNIQQNDKELLQNMVKNIAIANQNFDENSIYQVFNKNKIAFHNFTNSIGFTEYIPEQIRISLEKALKQESSIEIIGCNGLKIMKKIANRKF